MAAAILSITDRGERDPVLIKERALNAVGARKFSGAAGTGPSPINKEQAASAHIVTYHRQRPSPGVGD